MDKFDFDLSYQITDCQGYFGCFKSKAYKSLYVYFYLTTDNENGD